MNKLANDYFQTLLKALSPKEANILGDTLEGIKSYRPFNSVDASIKGIPGGAALGAAAGGLIQAFRDNGYDEAGMKRKKYKEILKGMLLGGTVGGLGALALPSVAQGGIVAANKFVNRNKSMFTDPLDVTKNNLSMLGRLSASPLISIRDIF